jgi:bifunctional enzyme CysN/CysC
MGTIASGQLHRGDGVQVAVSGVTSAVERIFVDNVERELAIAGESVGLELSSHIDVGRGEVLVHPAQRPHIADQFAAQLLCVSAEALLPGRDYTMKMAAKEVTATVTAVKHRLDFETLRQEAARTLQQGDVGACTIATAAPLALDTFAEVPHTSKFALYDRYSDALIAAGTVEFALRRGENIHTQPLSVSKQKRALLKAQKPCILWFTGLSGAGKSTIANLVEGQLARRGAHTYLLDGDNVRHGLNKNLGFTAADRVENIRRVGEVAKLFVDAGLIVLCSFISPFRAERAAVRGLVEPKEFIEIFVHAPLAECERRDPKGLYAKSRAGALPNFTGIDSPYEDPANPDIVLDTSSAAAADLATPVIALLEARGSIAAEAPKSL